MSHVNPTYTGDQVSSQPQEASLGSLVSDLSTQLPDLIRPWTGDRRYTVLGTDGFGRSDTRAALRRFFEVDRDQIVLAALQALAREGTIGREVLARAAQRHGAQAGLAAPWQR